MTSSTATQTQHAVPVRTVMLLAFAAFASSINIRACDPLLPQIAQGFDASVGSAAAIITAFAVGYGMTQLLFGPVGDRYGKYLVVALTAIAAGIATSASALMPSLKALVTARFVAGGFAAAAIPLAFAWIGDAVPFERRQGVLARFLSAQMTGIILGQAAGGTLGDLFGWRSVFWIIGALHVVAGAAMLVELKLNPSAQPPGAASRPGFSSLAAGILDILRRPWVRVMLVAVFVEAFAFYGAFAYIGADLHHRFGLSFTSVGLVMSVYGGGAIVYSLSAKRLLATLGERGLVLAGGAFMALGFVALALAPSIVAVPPVMVLQGLAFYMMHNTLQTNATQMAPEARGLGVSMFALALFSGQSLGVALAAPVMDRWGAAPIFLAAAAILPFAALWFRARLAIRPAP
ncbi:MAG: MFS transporter [Hyphomicrobiaceae bacterium]